MKPVFTSIRYPFSIDPALGRLEQESDYAEHVEQLIKQVLLTAPGERVNRPDFGCGLKRMVFAPNSEVSATLAQISIVEALHRWLDPVIEGEDVKVTAVNETLSVRLSYVLKVRQERRYLNLEVTP